MENTIGTINIILGFSLVVMIATGCYLLSKKIKSVPFPILLLIAGMLFSSLRFEPLESIRLTPDLVLFIFLPILLFESAIKFEFRLFRKVLAPGFLLATVGLGISIMIVSAGVSYFIGIPFKDALLFASIISSTDPIAVLTILNRLGAPKKLKFLIDAESFLNDATSVILFRVVSAFVITGSATVGSDTVVSGVGAFLEVLLVGVLIGAIFGWIFANIISQIKNESSLETALTIILASTVYVFTEHYFHASGIIAVLVAGIVMGNYGETKISPEIKEKLFDTWEFLAFMVTAVLFFLIGIEIDIDALVGNLGLILVTIPTIIFARAVSVYVTGAISNVVFPKNRIPFNWLHIVNWSGLRGILPLAIALTLQEGYEYKELFLQLILFAIYFSLIFNGSSVEILLNKLGVNKEDLSNNIEAKITELLILSNLQISLKTMLDRNEISKAVYEEHQKNISVKLEDVKGRLNDWKAGEIYKKYKHELNNVLRRYCLQIEKNVYGKLFERGVINENVYNKLRYCIEDQKELIDIGEQPFKKGENSFYKQVFKKESSFFGQLIQFVRGIVFAEPKLHDQTVKESYLYHKARLLGNEQVSDELHNLKKFGLHMFDEKTLHDVDTAYSKFQAANHKILARIEKEYAELAACVDEDCYMAESKSLVRNMLHKLGEEERISYKTLKQIKLSV